MKQDEYVDVVTFMKQHRYMVVPVFASEENIILHIYDIFNFAEPTIIY